MTIDRYKSRSVHRVRLLNVAFLLLGGLTLSVAYAHGPTRQKVTVERSISATPEKCWSLVGNFAALGKWLPPVSKVEILEGEPTVAGAVRRVYVGERHLDETLKTLKPDRMQLKYKISVNNLDILPVNNYSSTLTVKSQGEGCVVKWLGAFYRGYPNNDPPEHLNDASAIAAVEGLYNLGLDNLKTILESH